jgi:hypothetical protein
MSEARLSADGARRLRDVRDHIVAHPEEFDMLHWYPSCGTACCIGGHLGRVLRAERGGCFITAGDVADALGFVGIDPLYYGLASETDPISGALTRLFYSDLKNNDPAHHAKRINAFLWEYGYPERELDLPVPSERPRASQNDGLQAAHAEVVCVGVK